LRDEFVQELLQGFSVRLSRKLPPSYIGGDADGSSGVFGASSGRGDFSLSVAVSSESESGCESIFKMPTGVVQRMAVGLMASSVTPSVSLEPA
jgi:hypothetical protein